MAKSLFDTIHREFKKTGYKHRSLDAKTWFRDRVKELNGKINRRRLLKDENLNRVEGPRVGRMYMYVYDPKLKEELPYYDRFPLIIMVGPAKGGFYGINLHYLPPLLRAGFLDVLIQALGTEKSNLSVRSRFKISYKKLMSMRKLKAFAPCFKHYLANHVKSQIAEVPPADWETAVFLPTQSFAKRSKETVWRDSRQVIG